MLNTYLQRPCRLLLITAGFALFVGNANAGELRIAVASNFVNALNEIAERFEAETGHEVKLSAGSTGKHYAQIINGAPFDLFLAADAERPERLELEGYAVSGSRFTYAIGELVLWSLDPGTDLADGELLSRGDFRFLAIANPELAPYGRAAREVLLTMGTWEKLQNQIVFGENINQAFHFVYSGNAELGLIARSQLKFTPGEISGASWTVPGNAYTPIEQQAVMLRDSLPAKSFLKFLRSSEVIELIQQYGYRSP